MDDTTIRITRAQNGFIVNITDPDIVKQNRSSDRDLVKGGKNIPWRDPNVSFTFATAADAGKFITDNIDRAFPDDEKSSYSSSFDLAAKEEASA